MPTEQIRRTNESLWQEDDIFIVAELPVLVAAFQSGQKRTKEMHADKKRGKKRGGEIQSIQRAEPRRS